jgi:benzaldehyde dehydrogenase (NAD)
MTATGTFPTQALIAGQWVDGSGGTIELRSVWADRVLGELQRCDATDADRAVQAAVAAQRDWAARPPTAARWRR